MNEPRTRIKFCGLTRLEDALLAAELRVDFAGFICVPESPRYLAPQAAQSIVGALPKSIESIALFQNASAAAIRASLQIFAPRLLQFHGSESADFCAQFGLPWIKAVAMGEVQVFREWERDFAQATALLADSHTAAGGGGSGHVFEWSQLPAVKDRRLPLLLAGGLKPETVAAAIQQVQPWAVDVSSGIEGATKGVKDHRKMRAFVEAVRAVDEA